MTKFNKGVSIVISTLAATVFLFILATRFTDGSLAIFTGGPFTTGEIAEIPNDWSFLRDRDLIEFQTLNPSRSRTVWLAVHDQRLFIVSGYMNTTLGKIWKQWPYYLDNDDRIILRIDDVLYEQRLQRIMQGPEVVPVLNEIARKYFSGGGGLGAEETVSSGDTWLFEVMPR